MKKKSLFKASVFTMLAALLFVNACIPDIPLPEETPQDEYAVDNLPGLVNPPYELDEEILKDLVKLIERCVFGKIHSLLIIHNDSLVLEEYFRGWSRHMRHYCFSTTKSVTSALIGIAIDQGKIDGVNGKLLGFFPEYDDIMNIDERKESITLENLLTMSSGFAWDEISTPYLDIFGKLNPQNDANKMIQSSDWIKYMLDLPMSDDPGVKFVYSTGGTMLLSGIIKNKTGQSAEEFAEENLFAVLGITSWEWETGPNGISDTGGGRGGLYLHPVNMALFGYLYLKEGWLNGERVISESWVEESTAKHTVVKNPYSGTDWSDYGYQWWRCTDDSVEGYLKTNDMFYAFGYGGQFIFVIPHLNMVVVITAENFARFRAYGFFPATKMLFDYILPAVKEG